jgi:hypothetical protein
MGPCKCARITRFYRSGDRDGTPPLLRFVSYNGGFDQLTNPRDPEEKEVKSVQFEFYPGWCVEKGSLDGRR